MSKSVQSVSSTRKTVDIAADPSAARALVDGLGSKAASELLDREGVFGHGDLFYRWSADIADRLKADAQRAVAAGLEEIVTRWPEASTLVGRVENDLHCAYADRVDAGYLLGLAVGQKLSGGR